MTGAPADLGDDVARVYVLMRDRDTTALAQHLDQLLDDAVTVTVPGSLPYGGVVSGVQSVKRAFLGMVVAGRPVRPESITIEAVAVGGDYIAVQLACIWQSPSGGAIIPTRVTEWWRRGPTARVLAIDAFYWDTAECLRAAAQPEPAQ